MDAEIRVSESDARVRALCAALTAGIASPDARAALAALGVGADAEDRRAARVLVGALTSASIARLTVASAAALAPRSTAPPAAPDDAVSGAGARHHEPGAGAAAVDVPRDTTAIDPRGVDDLWALLALLRAGSLSQRRAAVERLREIAAAPARGKAAAERAREAIEALEHNRDVEIEYEISAARAALPGLAGREERAAREGFDAAVTELSTRVAAFWAGESEEEPLRALPGDVRAQVLLRVRDLPDELIAHVSAVLEGVDGVSSLEQRRQLAAALRYGGDVRLLPSFGALLLGTDAPLAMEAARALRRIEGPRAVPLLRAAFERLVTEGPRAVVAGALGEHGDRVGREHVLQVLAQRDEATLPLALEALETLGTAAEVECVSALLEGDARVAAAAARALARFGDARALPALEAAARRAPDEVALADLRDAAACVRARLELRGEEAPPPEAAMQTYAAASRAALASQGRDPTGVRLRALWDLAVGRLLLLLGSRERAAARFEAAAARRPGWAAPLLALAESYVRQGLFAQAIGAFRRAVEADRRRVEGSPLAVRALARAFLRRADELDQAGRGDVALALVAEVNALDLRLASSALRFELRRRYDAARAARAEARR
jgi:tetratricopeptide (TPR) repeat protein